MLVSALVRLKWVIFLSSTDFFFFLLLSFLRLLAVKLLFSSSDIVSGRNEVPAVLFRFRCSGLHDCIDSASSIAV